MGEERDLCLRALDANSVCAEMRGKMEYDFRNVVTDGNRLFTGFLEERQTGLEPATSTLARWRTTNCTTVAFFLSLMYLSDESYNNTVSSAWQAFS